MGQTQLETTAFDPLRTSPATQTLDHRVGVPRGKYSRTFASNWRGL